jgi:hypothetical protein
MAAPATDILSAAQRRELLAAFRQDRKSSIWPWIGAFAFLTVLPLILYALNATVSLPLTLGGLLTVAILYVMDQRASWKYSQTQLHRLCVMLRSRSPFRRITGARPGPIRSREKRGAMPPANSPALKMLYIEAVERWQKHITGTHTMSASLIKRLHC